MKWINGYTDWKKHEMFLNHKKNWHLWFAWYPVVIDTTDDEREVKVWFEKIMRKGISCYNGMWAYEYKVIEKGEK